MLDQAGVAPPHFIVVVPGYMGSRLRSRSTGETVWIDFATIPKNPLRWDDWLEGFLRSLAYPNEDLEAAGIVDEVVFVPPWAKQEQYGRLLAALERMGYQTDPEQYGEQALDVYCFAYDWRQDNRISARQLAEAVERWRGFHPGAEAWLIAHSNGGLVARWYIEKEGGKDRVGRLFLMASPWDGVPRAMRMVFNGLEVLFRRGFDPFHIAERTRDVIRTFPSVYQLLPYRDPFLHDANNQQIDLFKDTGWLEDDGQRQLLAEGRRFNEELGTTLSVETLCFFGRKQPTQTYGTVRLEAGGRWAGINWSRTEAGDGTVPERSAVHPQAIAKLPFVAGHGDIYVNPAVLEFLQWELVDRYTTGRRALVSSERLSVLFEPNADVYAPGEAITLSGFVQGAEQRGGTRPAIMDASITVELAWQGPLPGGTAPVEAPESRWGRLAPTTVPGGYQGQLEAPAVEGYYMLTGTVDAPGVDALALTEMIMIEAPAG